ncbi:MAG: DNA mismatch repair protein MutS [Fimbriimonadaceae bacterium]|nr:DNA mismatch repair protein MutS [Fimbriimonadaceae bacterium]
MKGNTPMLKQYFALKAEHPGVLMAIRVGDFYEFYGEDAEKAAASLEITLTSREDGGDRMPMAGVPYHAFEKYLAKALSQGIKVAICEQLEDPKQAKGLVKRGITRILTPGTLVEDAMLQSGQNNFLAAICSLDGRIGLAVLDPSTGEFAVTEVEGSDLDDRMVQELARLKPTELLVGPSSSPFGEISATGLGSAVTEVQQPALDRARRRLLEQLNVAQLDGFGCDDKPSAVIAASMVLSYAEKNGLPLAHIDSLSTYSVESFMRLDGSTRRSLEITQNLQDGSKKYTLLSVVDAARTPMGSRQMRRWLEQPLLDRKTIELRHEAVEKLVRENLIRGDLQDEMRKISDIERLVSRCATGMAGPRDLVGLRNSLQALPSLVGKLGRLSSGRLLELLGLVSDHDELKHLLNSALQDEPPLTIRDGGIIKESYDIELDKLRDLSRNGRKYIADLEQAERESTGINNLKVGFNSVFGYYLEISKSQLDKVPDHYIRKQTTANAERYITAALKEHESLVLGADEKAIGLETDVFYRLRNRVTEHSRALLQTAKTIAEIDVLCAFAEVSAYRGYVRPELVDEDVLEIEAGRHPVVEAQNSAFVPNDLELGDQRSETGEREGSSDQQSAIGDQKSEIGNQRSETGDREGLGDQLSAIGNPVEAGEPINQQSAINDLQSNAPNSAPQIQNRIVILTGPNMSGKSTYLRQTALIVLLAQVGCFVPARSCRLGICDRIFARIGAKDELALGQSTFMVEMIESANILNHATERSLVILDEVGRGTSTYDGMAIAWAMIEHLAMVGAKTLFATHYHQLNALADQLPTVSNYRVSVEEIGDDVVWTHRVLPGGTDRSYGIHVAKMAGVPHSVLIRSQELLDELEQGSSAPKVSTTSQKLQLTLFDVEPPPVMKELDKVDVNRLTPIEALRLIDDWKRKFGAKS